MDYKAYTKEELTRISKEWCDAYESGNPVVSDTEYDNLVQYLNTENTSEIGSEGQTDTYTVKHSIIMGSLAKVHTIKNKETGEINFSHAVYSDSHKNAIVLKEVNNVLSKANNARVAEFSPKLDGNSFSLEVSQCEKGNCIQMTCAQRGNGKYGPDILPHFLASKSYEEHFSKLEDATNDLLPHYAYDKLVIRGEAIVKNSVYNEKYAEKFKNPRVFISGTLNREFDEDDKDHAEHLAACRDIDYICYDYRLVDSATGDYMELSWMNPESETCKYLVKNDYIDNIGQLPEDNSCFILNLDKNHHLTEFQIANIYHSYENIRKDSDYSLDGIVVKPEVEARQKNLTSFRPVDMIAIKFIPEKMHSVITDIVWTISQNGECYPNGRIVPVKYDGKDVKRVGLHGYSYLITNKCGIGSEVEMVMNGDIVPGVDAVLSEGTIKMPDYETYVDTIGDNPTPHLFKVFSVEDKQKHQFTSSAKALQIDGIKQKTAAKIWDACHIIYENTYHTPLINLMLLMLDPICYSTIYNCMGKGKAIENIITALDKYKKKMTVSDIIRGLCIEDCGEVTSNVCADIISGLDYDTTGLNESAYSWALDKNSENYKTVIAIALALNVSMKKEKGNIEDSVAITDYVILTGSPKDAGFSTKSEWLKQHPQYAETTKWNECTLLVTNDLESKTGKMAKAEKLGIPVRTYFD